jgi:sulfiredoxin
MMRREKFAIANIYVPIKRRATLRPETVQEIAQSILEVGQQVPIPVRRDGDRFVLVHGLHRLEACKALGEETIYGYLTQAQKHYSAEALGKGCPSMSVFAGKAVIARRFSALGS